jgi:hypothetical protein
MTQANEMRGLLKLMEKAPQPEYSGPREDPQISYSAETKGGEITKVVANLRSYESGRYTKLGRNLKRIERLESRIKSLKEQTKQESRELVADLFHAEDAARTRVVETVSFIFHMTKDPSPVSSVKYAKVLEELEKKLTPELLEVMQTLVTKHTGAPVQKAPSLKATDKADQTEESIMEAGLGEKLKGLFAKVRSWVDSWGANYDMRLNALKAQAGINEGLEEDQTTTMGKGQLVRINCPSSSAHGDYGSITGQSEDGRLVVTLYGLGFQGVYDESELEAATEEQVSAHYGQVQEDDTKPVKVNHRTSSEPRFTEADLRLAHKDGYLKGRKTSPSYTGGYHSSMWDLSAARAKLGLGPRGR